MGHQANKPGKIVLLVTSMIYCVQLIDPLQELQNVLVVAHTLLDQERFELAIEILTSLGTILVSSSPIFAQSV